MDFMKNIAESGLKLLKKSETEVKKLLLLNHDKVSIYPESIHKLGESLVMIGRDETRRFLLVVADCPKAVPEGFEGEMLKLSDGGPDRRPLRRQCGRTAPPLPLDRTGKSAQPPFHHRLRRPARTRLPRAHPGRAQIRSLPCAGPAVDARTLDDRPYLPECGG